MKRLVAGLSIDLDSCCTLGYGGPNVATFHQLPLYEWGLSVLFFCQDEKIFTLVPQYTLSSTTAELMVLLLSVLLLEFCEGEKIFENHGDGNGAYASGDWSKDRCNFSTAGVGVAC